MIYALVVVCSFAYYGEFHYEPEKPETLNYLESMTIEEEQKLLNEIIKEHE